MVKVRLKYLLPFLLLVDKHLDSCQSLLYFRYLCYQPKSALLQFLFNQLVVLVVVIQFFDGFICCAT